MATRPAEIADLPALVTLENEAFASDRLSRRSFNYYIRAPRAVLLVCERQGVVAGYSLISIRKGSRVARLNSLAVARPWRGHGLGLLLLKASETAARRAGAIAMHLEVRAASRRAIAFYERNFYRRTGRIENYYEDAATAWRYEKLLRQRRSN